MYKETIVFYTNDINDLKTEFKTTFNELVENDNSEGFYTFYFVWYHEYKIRTEVCYSVITNKTAVFLWHTGSMVLNLDPNLQVTSGDIVPETVRFGDAFGGDDSSTLVYVDTVCNIYGNIFEVYSLKYENTLALTNKMLDDGWIDINSIQIDEDDMMYISLEHLDETIETFQTKVDEAIEMDSPYTGLDENPYSNRYYDKDFTRKIKLSMGDNDV